MISTKYLPILMLLASLIMLNACDVLNTPVVDTPVPGIAQTYAAQTLAFVKPITESNPSPIPLLSGTPVPAAASATSTPTPAGPPTATAFPTVPTELFNPQQVITDSLRATIDPATYPTPDYTQKLEDGSPAPCNAAKFIADITVPDEMRIPVGEKFTKIWRVQNIGACAWNPSYALVLSWGNDFGVEPPVWLDRIVKPGEIYDIVMNMEAPYLPACWQGNWMFQDPEGLRFGVGYKFTTALHVLISVYLPRVGPLSDPCKIEQ